MQRLEEDSGKAEQRQGGNGRADQEMCRVQEVETGNSSNGQILTHRLLRAAPVKSHVQI